jgi:hypothetical protein
MLSSGNPHPSLVHKSPEAAENGEVIRKSFTLAAPLFLVGALAAGQSSVSAAEPSLAEAGKKTAAIPTMQMSMKMDLTIQGQGKTIGGKITSIGKLDKPKRAQSFDMDMTDYMTKIMTASGQPVPTELNTPSMFMVKIIAIGDKLWMNFPMFTAITREKAAKPWTQFDMKSLGADVGDVMGSQGGDPTAALDYLNGLSKNAKAVGKEKIRGIDTTKYSGTVELATLLKNVPPAQQADMKVVFGTKPTIPVTVWIDGQSQVRRMDMTLDVTTQGMSVKTSTSTEFFAFGEPVSIAAPPANQVGSNPTLEAAIKQAVLQKKPKKAA